MRRMSAERSQSTHLPYQEAEDGGDGRSNVRYMQKGEVVCSLGLL